VQFEIKWLISSGL